MDKQSKLSHIFEQLEKGKKALKARRNKTITDDVQNRSFVLLSEDEIALVLAHRAKTLRLKQNIKQKELGAKANLSSATTYSNFEQTGKISLINFLKVMRALGKITEMENILKLTISDEIEGFEDDKLLKRKRVR